MATILERDKLGRIVKSRLSSEEATEMGKKNGRSRPKRNVTPREYRDWIALPNNLHRVSSDDRGDVCELLAMADMIRRGYEVFIPIRRKGTCDFVAIVNDMPLRVEVKLGGTYAGYQHEQDKYDLLIRVKDEQIAYCGPYADLFPDVV